MMEAATKKEAKALTLVFWDIKKFPVPPSFDARRVRPCIKRLLKNHGYYGPLTINAVGILTDVHEDILGALFSSGINLYYAPYGSSDIKELMSESMSNNPSPTNIMGICDHIAFPRRPKSGYNLIEPFSYSSPEKDAISWMDLILAESEALGEDTCSQTDESASWVCLICEDLRGEGFEIFTSHLSSPDHLFQKFDFLPFKNYLTMDKFEDEDENPPTIVRKQPDEATPEEAMAITSVYWDINIFPIPSGFDALRVSMCIKRLLEKYGYYGPLTIHAVGILTDVPNDILEALSSTGIILCHAVHGSTDILLLMSWWISKNPPPVNILGICDPRGFPVPSTGYNIFRAFPYSSPQLDGQLWKSTLMAGPGILEEDMCSETGESARRFCLVCKKFHGEGFERLTQHLGQKHARKMGRLTSTMERKQRTVKKLRT